MKKFWLVLVISLGLVSCGSQDLNDTKVSGDIYFDSTVEQSGDGSENSPYKNLSVLKDLVFSGDTNIYLKKGATFNEQLHIYNAGDENTHILVTAYGNGNKKPIINGGDTEGFGTVYLKNCQNITISNLEITDSATTEGNRIGVCIDADPETFTTYSNISIKNNYIHDIHGTIDEANRGMDYAVAKHTGGIIVKSSTANVQYDNLTIKGNTITRCDLEGIATFSGTTVSVYDSNFKNFGHTNMNIADNEISYIAKNAIFVRGLYGGFIQNNTIYETAIKAHAGNTIVTSQVNGTVIQNNEGYFNRANTEDGKDYQDGCMLDADLASPNTIWQYNYSHDNSFGLFLNCNYKSGTSDENALNDRIIVRFNVSVNDYGNKGIIYLNYKCKAISIYNNTIITGENTKYIFASNKNNPDKTYFFRNNLIYNRSAEAVFDYENSHDVDAEFEYNLVYNETNANIDYGSADFAVDNKNGIFDQNPRLLYTLPNNVDARTGFAGKKLAKISYGSPCLNAGNYESDLLNFSDIYGNEYENPCIGCCSQGYVS